MIPKPKKGLFSRGAWEVTRKLLKAIPVIGPVFVVGFAGRDIHRKGLVPGVVHVGLDVTPWVGTAKNIVEIFTGDLIPDKPPKSSQLPIQAAGTMPTPQHNTHEKVLSPPSQPERTPTPSRVEALPSKN